MTYQEIVTELSEELEIPEEVVDTAYKSFFEFIRETIVSLPLKDELSEEDFSQLRTNFNIPSLINLNSAISFKTIGFKYSIPSFPQFCMSAR